MKKLIISVFILCLALPVFSRGFEKGKDYFILPTRNEHIPDVIEFISFNCSHCYYVERKTNIDKQIIANLPVGTTFKQLHASVLPPMCEELTKVWVVSQYLGKAEQVKAYFFDLIPEKKRRSFIYRYTASYYWKWNF